MQLLTLAELQAPDEAVRRFTPLGFDTGGMLSAEDAAEYQQRGIATADLVAAVPDGVRHAFERLRTLHSYGLLCYETFTAVVDLAPRVAELALRQRFVLFHEGSIRTVGRNGVESTAQFESVGDLVAQLKETKQRVADWPRRDPFRGGFAQLLEWARRVGLLTGQRARHMEQRLAGWRNLLAHPDGHHLLMPVDSARDIHDLAEFINRLWGSGTAGGRLYPAPVVRDILALAHRADQDMSVGLAEALDLHPSLADATILLVRGNRDDEGLFEFDAAYENTRFPTELLWGPGTYAAALYWLGEERPEPDMSEYLDRCFLVRRLDAQIDRPRTPDVAAGLPLAQRDGHWYAVRSDFPLDALGHVRGHHAFTGTCRECASEGISEGNWSEVLADLTLAGERVVAVTSPNARMPGRWRS